MDKKDILIWMKTSFPTTIINDRYGGSYSGGWWLAFPLEHIEVPDEVNGCDRACASFWDQYTGPVGKGGSPEEAFDNLKTILSEQLNDNNDERELHDKIC